MHGVHSYVRYLYVDDSSMQARSRGRCRAGLSKTNSSNDYGRLTDVHYCHNGALADLALSDSGLHACFIFWLFIFTHVPTEWASRHVDVLRRIRSCSVYQPYDASRPSLVKL